MVKRLFLFDVDGTLTESGENMTHQNILLINKLKEKNSIGIVGGGKYEKILEQTNSIIFNYYFSECGCVYHNESGKLIYKKNIRNHPLYNKINILVKICLNFLSNVDYEITGNFIDLRNGIIYISLIGMSANNFERNKFKELDKIYCYREKLINILHKKALELNIFNEISILFGGSVGISIYPIEYDKQQVLNYIDQSKYDEIHYFGDKYLNNGNDQLILLNPLIIPHKIDNVEETFEIISNYL